MVKMVWSVYQMTSKWKIDDWRLLVDCCFNCAHFCFAERYECGCDAIRDSIGRVYVNTCHPVAHQSIITRCRVKSSLDKTMAPFHSTRCLTIATVWRWCETSWLIRRAWRAFASRQRTAGFYLVEKINYSRFIAPTHLADSVATHLNRCAHRFSILLQKPINFHSLPVLISNQWFLASISELSLFWSRDFPF